MFQSAENVSSKWGCLGRKLVRGFVRVTKGFPSTRVLCHHQEGEKGGRFSAVTRRVKKEEGFSAITRRVKKEEGSLPSPGGLLINDENKVTCHVQLVSLQQETRTYREYDFKSVCRRHLVNELTRILSYQISSKILKFKSQSSWQSIPGYHITADNWNLIDKSHKAIKLKLPRESTSFFSNFAFPPFLADLPFMAGDPSAADSGRWNPSNRSPLDSQLTDCHVDQKKTSKFGALTIKEPVSAGAKVITPIMGKGKQLKKDRTIKTPRVTSRLSVISKRNDFEASSSSDMKLIVNRFGIPNNKNSSSALNFVNDHSDVRKNAQVKIYEETVKQVNIGVDGTTPLNPWTRRPNIKVNFIKDNFVLTEDGLAVKLHEPSVKENSEKLKFSVVVKVFGKNIPVHVIAEELRRQWMQFGKFHLTILSFDRVLCSFFSSESMENVMSGGPWFVSGHIVGIDKWTPEFSTTSLKGLTSPVWVRLLHLPLYCWDEINVARIASLIGIPLLIDGNMFQWGRREFARVCVRADLDKKLPLGV
ncbi:hypothetical protein M5K25_006937 [Dendrobium thyrsiflorum]|uniref:DUF4283 domain-containing protein n=1 Tax=Dendrobium thyrsiflorum TaxID=117978 RepID=A0ABD0VCI5_DENTH